MSGVNAKLAIGVAQEATTGVPKLAPAEGALTVGVPEIVGRVMLASDAKVVRYVFKSEAEMSAAAIVVVAGTMIL
jgi:hypothetical protein